MLRKTLLAVAMIFLSIGTGICETTVVGNTICLSAPGAPWELCFPRESWQLSKTTKTDSGVYHMFWNEKGRFNASFFIEKATTCKSSDDCMKYHWNNVKATTKGIREGRIFPLNGFSIVEYTIPAPPQNQVFQYHYSAHMVRDGFWVDMHLSRFPGRSGDDRRFSGFVNSIQVRTRGM